MLKRLAVRSLAILRDGWLIAGISLGLLLTAEVVYRIQGPVRLALSAPEGAPDRDAPDWFADYLREYDAAMPMRWAPYVYFRRQPFEGRYITVNHLGLRETPQPALTGAPVARVFFFGGSTMWGAYLRDAHTIPAEASRRIHAKVGPGHRVAVTNFGESGYVFSQELLELMLQLRQGNRPDVVVFYHGVNDVWATLQDGRAGIPLNEANRVAEFASGRDLRGADGGRPTLGSSARAVASLALAGLQQLALVRRLQQWVRPDPPPLMPVDEAVRGLVDVYAANARLVEALGRGCGFHPIYVWQPSPHITRKRLTPYEVGLTEQLAMQPFNRRLQEVHQAVLAPLESAMASVAPGRFLNASGLFDDLPFTAFQDSAGHNTEAAVPHIVDRFWPLLNEHVTRAIASASAPAQAGRPGCELPVASSTRDD